MLPRIVFRDYGHKRARNTRIGPGGGICEKPSQNVQKRTITYTYLSSAGYHWT